MAVAGLRISILLMVLAASVAHSRRLPIRTYNSADGLARDHILCIVQDSRGFLWLCTPEGLSRFDGYGFTNYHKEQGLPGEYITDFLQTRRGAYWVGTGGGLARFDPTGRGPRFQVVPLSAPDGAAIPLRLYEDRSGGVWCLADHGIVFHLGPGETVFRSGDFHLPDQPVSAVLEDTRGGFWIGTGDGLFRRDGDKPAVRYGLPTGFAHAFIQALFEDRDGRLWIGTRDGLIRIEGQRMHVYTTKDGLPANRIQDLLETSDGTLLASTTDGLVEWTPGHPDREREFQAYSLAEGLSEIGLTGLAEDRDGNVWIGTAGSGVMKLNRSGLVTYTETDGAGWPRQFLEDRQGDLCVVSIPTGKIRVSRFEERRFRPFEPAWPASLTDFGWGTTQIALQDRAGEWWIATGEGLFRFPPVERVEELAGLRPKAIYTTRDGLGNDAIFKIFDDANGDIWVGTGGTRENLARWDRKMETLHRFSQADGLPRQVMPLSFSEDRAGDLWITLLNGSGLVRYRGGRFSFFPRAALGGISPRTVFADSAGRVWAATSRGVARVENPDGDSPHLTLYDRAAGLSSNDVTAITEDRFGRLYAVTGRGVDRFEAEPDGLHHWKHYTTADGIAPGEIRVAWHDRHGTIWVGTSQGISQLIPGPDPVKPAPPVLITGLSGGGLSQPISDLGGTSLSGFKLPQRPISVEYSGLSFVPGEALRYEYKLEPVDREWSLPTDQRAVTYAGLAPGRYRFLVRALAGDGAASPQPASVAFTIPTPVWRTWWFLTACAIGAASLVYVLHLYRVTRLLAVANVRTRIARDLHDDIGTSLSQIAVLSELAQDQTRPPGRSGVALSEIAAISRELVDSMSDIVWSINPQHDRLGDLVYHMRRFAADLLESRDIELDFHSSVADHDFKIEANLRRQVYLVFKEAVYNAARHSGAGCVKVRLERRLGLMIEVSDNGHGFDPAAEHEGNGLINIRKRASALKAMLEVCSAPGSGATLKMSVPLDNSRRPRIFRGK
jgi:ligand-binding sensor domain-containing protein/two-component sensor histidine kinase